MSPNKTNNNGGTRGRVALTLRGDAARPGELDVLARSFAMLSLITALLVACAPELWPHLFAQ